MSYLMNSSEILQTIQMIGQHNKSEWSGLICF